MQRLFMLFGIKSHRGKTFKLSNYPFFIEKVWDVRGLIEPAGKRARTVRRREEPDPGSQPDPAHAADGAEL